MLGRIMISVFGSGRTLTITNSPVNGQNFVSV